MVHIRRKREEGREKKEEGRRKREKIIKNILSVGYGCYKSDVLTIVIDRCRSPK
ncbi:MULTISPECIES: hypothetical protein [unclassified Microcoleus]|uniref:hypothetical protein n=1 Tax=unclassified Microcoleus TaxID=2642155 RepID=UPI002FD6822E